MNANKIINELSEYEPRGMHEHQLPVVWQSAHGDTVTDIEGKKYIDFTSGIFVTNVGHGTVAGAVKKQADKLIHCYTFPHSSRLNLAKKLRQLTGFEKSFFLSAGTEATDCAVKIMREARKAITIVSLYGSMHGKSMCAENLRGCDGTNTWAVTEDFTYSFYHLMNPFTGSFKEDMAVLLYKRAPKEIAGFMIESYRGWNAQFYDRNYIRELMSFAREHSIPVCFDEIQGGFGRTGKLFAYEHYDAQPDLVCIGKGLGGGLPISAVLGSARFLDIPDDLSSTHSANPLCCEAALASLEYLEKHNLARVAREKGILFSLGLRKFERHPCIKEINTRGLLTAIIFKNTAIADRVILRAMKRGLLMVRTGREAIKIGPPLTISLEALNKGLNILELSIRDERPTKRITK